MKEYKYIYIIIIILITLSIIYATDYFKLKGLLHEYRINNNLFQIVTPEYLNTVNTESCKDILDLFEVDYIVDKRYKKNYITLSLFCQNVNNSLKDDLNSVITDIGSSWYNKYFFNLIKIIKDFNKSQYKEEWGIRLYLEPLLSHLVEQLQNKNVEIYVMKNNSIGLQPGTLWRFLSADDRNLESIVSFDIDENFNHISIWLEDVNICKKVYPDKKLIRLIYPHYKLDKKHFLIDTDDSALNCATILAGRFAFFPNRSNISWKDLMIKYMCLRIKRLTTSTPHLDYDSYFINTTPYNKPLKNDNLGLGWGGHPYKYGFDEKFLKVVIFPYFAKRGEVITIVNEKNEIENMLKTKPTGDSYFKIEYDYYSYYKNIYYTPKRREE